MSVPDDEEEQEELSDKEKREKALRTTLVIRLPKTQYGLD